MEIRVIPETPATRVRPEQPAAKAIPATQVRPEPLVIKVTLATLARPEQPAIKVTPATQVTPAQPEPPVIEGRKAIQERKATPALAVVMARPSSFNLSRLPDRCLYGIAVAIQ